MIAHTTLPVSDYRKSKAFYVQALAPLGYKNNMEVGEADPLVEAIVQGFPTACWTVPPGTLFATTSRRKPCTPCTVVGDHRAQYALASLHAREVPFDDFKGFSCFRVSRSCAIFPNLSAPAGGMAGKFASNLYGHRFALQELCAVAFLLRQEANLARKDISSASSQRRIWRLDEPDTRRNRQCIQYLRLSGAVVADQQGKAWIQLQFRLVEALEIPNLDTINSHGIIPSNVNCRKSLFPGRVM